MTTASVTPVVVKGELLSPRSSQLSFNAVPVSSTNTTITNSSDTTTSLGLVSTFRGSSLGYDTTTISPSAGAGVSSASATTYVTRSVPSDNRFNATETQLNGITRPNGVSKTLALPLGMNTDFDEQSFKDDPSKKRSG